jgi:tetratricopeptide (TPR) repeat protein
MATAGEKYERLRDFLLESFDASAFESFLVLKDYREVAEAVNRYVGREQYFFNVIDALDQRGWIDAEFFERLKNERPAKLNRIENLKSIWLDATLPEPATTTAVKEPQRTEVPPAERSPDEPIRDPLARSPVLAQGEKKQAEGRPETSIESQRGAERASQSFQYNYKRGITALKNEDYDSAILCFSVCVQENPEAAAAYCNRAIAYRCNKEHAMAIKDFTEAIRLDPESAVAHYHRGIAYRLSEKYDKAVVDFTQVIRLDEKLEIAAYFQRGIAQDRYDPYHRQYDKALKDYSRAILLIIKATDKHELNPSVREVYMKRAELYRTKRWYSNAAEDYSKLMELEPDQADDYCKRGRAYNSAKAYDKAIEDYNRAIQLEPNQAEGYYLLAWLLSTCPEDDVRDWKKATELATKACELSHWGDGRMIETLAAANAESRNFREAIKWQKHVIEKDLAWLGENGARKRLQLYEACKPYREKEE